jgi:hypothetical protein
LGVWAKAVDAGEEARLAVIGRDIGQSAQEMMSSYKNRRCLLVELTKLQRRMQRNPVPYREPYILMAFTFGPEVL